MGQAFGPSGFEFVQRPWCEHESTPESARCACPHVVEWRAAYDRAHAEFFARHTHELEPGQTCPTCARRVSYPRKESSPQSKTFSYRVPVDEAEAHEEVAVAAAEHLGVYDRPHWRFQLNTIAYAAVLQDASLKDVGRGS